MKAETSIVCALCLLALTACKEPDLMPGRGWVQSPATPDKVPPTANMMGPMMPSAAAGSMAAGAGGMSAGAAAAGMGGMAAGAAAAGMGGMAAGAAAAGMGGAAGSATPDAGMGDAGGG